MTIQLDASPAPLWSGRNDGDGDDHRRWHQAIVLQSDIAQTVKDKTVLIGFCCDEGVRRNNGRLGAAKAPAALRRALSPLAFHGDRNSVFDAGDVGVCGTDLESAQDRLGGRVAALLDGGNFVMVLGGGHETAYGSYLGLAASAAVPRPLNPKDHGRIGILNLDAHFDLRADAMPSSGTPFLQISDAEAAAGRELSYAVVGISEPNNTSALFDTAVRLGVKYLPDEHCGVPELASVREFVRGFIESVDVLYLTIDLDVLPAAVAPGVSAPAAYGVPFEVIHAICRQASESGKLALCDVVELNPAFDVDDRTARAAARLVHTIVRHHRR